MALDSHKYYNRQKVTSEYYYEVGQTIASGTWHYATFKAENQNPANQVVLNLVYDVITGDNQFGVAITTTPDYPGNNQGKLTSPDAVFQSERGRYSSSTDSWGWATKEKKIVINKQLDGGTYYIHIGYNKRTDSKWGLTGIDISTTSSSFEVSAARTYTVKYDSQQGTDNPASQTKKYGENLVLTGETPKRVGYTFAGWNSDPNGKGFSYDPSANFNLDQDITLYAQWEINTLTIKMHTNGGKAATNASPNMSINKDSIALYNNESQTIEWGSGNFNLWACNYAPWIKLAYPGKLIKGGEEFSLTEDGTGRIYDQSKEYSIEDFANIDDFSVEITLYVNWKSGGLVYVSNGTKWEPYQIYVSNGTKWEHRLPYISNGTKWDMYS